MSDWTPTPGPGDSNDAPGHQLNRIADNLETMRRLMVIGGAILIVINLIGVAFEIHISSLVSSLQGRL